MPEMSTSENEDLVSRVYTQALEPEHRVRQCANLLRHETPALRFRPDLESRHESRGSL